MTNSLCHFQKTTALLRLQMIRIGQLPSRLAKNAPYAQSIREGAVENICIYPNCSVVETMINKKIQRRSSV